MLCNVNMFFSSVFSLATDQCVDNTVFGVLLRVLNKEHEKQTFPVLIGALFLLPHWLLAPFIPQVEICRSHEYNQHLNYQILEIQRLWLEEKTCLEDVLFYVHTMKS